MQIEFPVDVGETVYLYDEETKLIYPMMVYDIRKNRTSNFKYMLVSTEYEWDNKFSVMVSIDDYNVTWFKSQSEAEAQYYEKTASETFFSSMLKISMLFDKFKYKDMYLTETMSKVKIETYDHYKQTISFKDSNGIIHNVPLSEIFNKITFK